MKYGAFALICVAAMSFLLWGRSQAAPPTRVVSEGNEKNPSINILVLGCDASGQRPDCILLVHVNGEDNRINFLSIPRDSKMRQGRVRKLNTVLALEDGEGAVKQIEALTGVSVDYYIKLKLGVFARVVDALGGVEYTVEQDMHYSDPAQDLYIDLQAGPQILSGDQCEQYCRYRSYAMGDLTRTHQQQKLLSALLQQKAKLQYVLKLPAVYNIIKEDTQTDLRAQDIAAYLPLARSMVEQGVEISGFECPGAYNDMRREGVSYYLIDRNELKELCATHFSAI